MRGSMPAWQVSETALAEFNRSYAVVSDLAEQSGTSSRVLMGKLSKLGVETTGAKTVGSTSRGHLVRHEDLVKSLLASVG